MRLADRRRSRAAAHALGEPARFNRRKLPTNCSCLGPGRVRFVAGRERRQPLEAQRQEERAPGAAVVADDPALDVEPFLRTREAAFRQQPHREDRFVVHVEDGRLEARRLAAEVNGPGRARRLQVVGEHPHAVEDLAPAIDRLGVVRIEVERALCRLDGGFGSELPGALRREHSELVGELDRRGADLGGGVAQRELAEEQSARRAVRLDGLDERVELAPRATSAKIGGQTLTVVLRKPAVAHQAVEASQLAHRERPEPDRAPIQRQHWLAANQQAHERGTGEAVRAARLQPFPDGHPGIQPPPVDVRLRQRLEQRLFVVPDRADRRDGGRHHVQRPAPQVGVGRPRVLVRGPAPRVAGPGVERPRRVLGQRTQLLHRGVPSDRLVAIGAAVEDQHAAGRTRQERVVLGVRHLQPEPITRRGRLVEDQERAGRGHPPGRVAPPFAETGRPSLAREHLGDLRGQARLAGAGGPAEEADLQGGPIARPVEERLPVGVPADQRGRARAPRHHLEGRRRRRPNPARRVEDPAPGHLQRSGALVLFEPVLAEVARPAHTERPSGVGGEVGPQAGHGSRLASTVRKGRGGQSSIGRILATRVSPAGMPLGRHLACCTSLA